MTDLSASSHIALVNAELFASGKYSDLTIISQGERFNVHRAMVCSQSKPLAAAVDRAFKESITGEIDLDDSEPAVVKKFLEFLYTGDYFDNRSSDITTTEVQFDVDDFSRLSKKERLSLKYGNSQSQKIPSLSLPTAQGAAAQHSTPDGVDRPVLLNAKLYIMADRYDVQPLKLVAKRKYDQVIANGWNDTEFTTSLKLLYENTPESDRLLKDTAITAARANLNVLAGRVEFASLCKSNGEIAFDILKGSSNIHTPMSRSCPSCGYNNY